MKKLLGIVVLGLLWANISFSKDLSGTNLLCDFWTKGTAIGIEFKNSKEGIYYEILKEKKWSIDKDKITYEVTPDYILMDGDGYYPSLTRKTLKLNNSFQCEILDIKDTNMNNFMEFVLEEFKMKNESENKL